jgi:hypothetical protein
MKSFISHYRAFRNQIFEECGDMEEDNIILLYSLYLENKHTVNPLAGIESFLNQYTSLFSPPNLDPDDEENDDDPFSANTSGV